MKYVFILAALFASEIAIAEMVAPEQMSRTQEVRFTAEEKALLDEIVPKLYGGRKIKEGELRPSVYIGNCTATVIGPEVLITAGHCRSSGSSVSFTYDRTRYSGSCKRHPDYSKDGWLNNDFALCKFSPKIDLPVWGDLSPVEVSVGDKVTMQGYGAGSNGVLNVGEAAIARINYMDIITNDSVHLGGGDSGGGLFKHVEDLINGPFILIGVNSRGGGNTSLFNRVALDRSQKFFRDYASQNSVEICGVNKDCGSINPSKCRVERNIFDYLSDRTEMAKEVYHACLKTN